MSAHASRRPSAAWRLWIAPAAWAVHFLAIYAFTAIACARMQAVGAVPAFIAIITLLAVVVLVGTIVISLRDRSAAPGGDVASFVHGVTATTCALAVVAVVWEALPAALVPACV